MLDCPLSLSLLHPGRSSRHLSINNTFLCLTGCIPQPIMDGPVPDYYGTLGVEPTASADDIRGAYKRESLRAHPDRFPNASAGERQRYTARFQSLADAYYVLSDSTRRAEYDSLRRAHGVGTGGPRPSARAGASASSATGAPPGAWAEEAEKEQESSFRFFQQFFTGSGAAGAAGASAGEDASSTETGQPQGRFGSMWKGYV